MKRSEIGRDESHEFLTLARISNLNSAADTHEQSVILITPSSDPVCLSYPFRRLKIETDGRGRSSKSLILG